MARKPDPKTEIRRERFREYCRDRGWLGDDGRWKVNEISLATNKPKNKISDLLNGNGPFGSQIADDLTDALGLPDGYFERVDAVEYEPVPMLSVVVGAGPGKENHVIETTGALQFTREFLRSVGVRAANAGIVKVRGYSMEPTIRDGSVLLVNRSSKEPVAGGIFVLMHGNDAIVKRLFLRDGVWVAMSDNQDREEYPDIVIDGSEPASIIGRVVWMGSRI